MRRLLSRAYDISMKTITAVIINGVGAIPQRAVSHNPPDPDGNRYLVPPRMLSRS